jgi:voltage-gated potassium channel
MNSGARTPSLTQFKKWRFLQLTVVLGLWMLLSPRLGDRWIVQAFMQVILLNAMFVTLWAGSEARRMRWILPSLWGLSFVASLVALLPLTPDHREFVLKIEIAARVPIVVACAAGILIYVFRRGAVTLDSIFAAVSAYLLIAFAFAYVYLFTVMSTPDSFRFPSTIAGVADPGLDASMMYFSFVTLATLGYGDILPYSESARMLAVIEAVVGQFYVAVIVAVLVSRLIAPAASKSDEGGSSSRPLE